MELDRLLSQKREKKGMKNVCFMMPSMEGGGAERVVSVLCNYLVQDGYNVKIYLLNRDVVEYTLDKRVQIDRTCIHDFTGIRKKTKRFLDIRKVLKHNLNATVVSFFSMYNLYILGAGVGLKSRIIVSERLDPAKSLPNNRILFAIRNILYKRAYRIVFQTPDAKAFFPPKVQDKGVIILNPLKNELPAPFVGERKNEVVTFARLEPQKNHSLLIYAFKEFIQDHSSYELHIYGKGTEEEKLRTLVENEGLSDRVFFEGFSDNVHAAIRESAMFVLPSNYEGLSNSMLEAMAIGLPCICTDCPPGGARMMIEDGKNGLLVPVGDKEAMRKAMSLIAEDIDLQKKISKNASKIRNVLSQKNICREWKVLLD